MSRHVDLFQFIALQVALLKLYKLWSPSIYSLQNFKFWSEFVLSSLVIFACFILPTGSQMLYVTKLVISGNGDIQETAGLLNVVAGELLVFCRLIILQVRHEPLTELISQLKSEEFQNITKSHPSEFKRSIEYSKKLYIYSSIISGIDVTFQVIVVPGVHGYKTLPEKMDFIFVDNNVLSKDEYFGYAFAFQVLYKLVLIPTYLAVQCLLWSFLLCAICHLDVLIDDIKNIEKLIAIVKDKQNCNENDAFKYVFINIIRHHCLIINFVKLIEKTFSEHAFVTLFLTASVICTSAVQILCIESQLRNLLSISWILAYMAILAVLFYLDCYFANTVTEKGLQLSTAVFNYCNWVNLSTAAKKDLIMFIAGAQRPLQLYAANIVPISLETFKQVMNWTYKGFAVMNRMRK